MKTNVEWDENKDAMRTAKRAIWILLAVFVLAAAAIYFSGCSAERNRELNTQNKGAAEFIQASLQQADQAEDKPSWWSDLFAQTKQAADDIQANCAEVELNAGAPDNPQPYSPAASAQVRQQSQVEREQGIIGGMVMDGVITTVSNIAPAAGTALSVLLAMWQWWKKRKADQQVRGLIEGGQNVLKLAKDGKLVSVEAAKEAMRMGQAAYNVYPEIKALVHDLQDKQHLSRIPSEPPIDHGDPTNDALIAPQ